MIKGIFFDAAGVLYQRARPTEDFVLNLLKNRGFSNQVHPEDLSQLAILHGQASQGLINYETFWEQFLLIHDVSEPSLRKTFIAEIIEYSNNVDPVPNAKETLQELKRRGYLLGVITDTMYPLEWKNLRLQKAGVNEFIDVIACSTVLGVHKPDPRIYSSALEQAQLSPEQSAFVGHLSIELAGARNAGMMTIAVNYDQNAIADYYCKSIIDLLEIPLLNNILTTSGKIQ
jgi:putative hydrolase of the HAD superfamily